MTKEDFELLLAEKMAGVEASLLSINYLSDFLWPHIEEALDAKFNAGLDKAIEITMLLIPIIEKKKLLEALKENSDLTIPTDKEYWDKHFATKEATHGN